VSRILLGIIKLYWRLPTIFRGRCIFHETCSRYVYRRTQEDGFRVGLAAMAERFRQCRPGYRAVLSPAGDLQVQLADGSRVPSDAMKLTVGIATSNGAALGSTTNPPS
jgi:putative component of membrane protein insertase Oxa1/YidC/SpoIIIJ protein YidD